MRIHSMTATFGKLEHETLTFAPGMNIVTGDNEWGKSTWCAFLTAMLYGMDTRAKTTKTALADKEHYAPWSGQSMSGRIDLTWEGREITIERSTRGRQLLGEFRAYETKTGLEIPELTAENCGQMLLGVEKSVFTRTAFVRLNDLPVGDDEALRRRLNNLVTTGDENSGGAQLARGLKELKNRIRYNRTGLLPQLEVKQEQLEGELAELGKLEDGIGRIHRRLAELEELKCQLENHLAALKYEAAREDARKVSAARQIRDGALRTWEDASEACSSLPDRDTALELLAEIDRLRENQQLLGQQLRELEEPEAMAPVPEAFAELSTQEALEQVQEDVRQYSQLTRRRWLLPLLAGLLILGGVVWGIWQTIPGAICASAGVIVWILCWLAKRLRSREAAELMALYGEEPPETWEDMAQVYAQELERYSSQNREYQAQRQNLESQLKTLNDNIRDATQEQGLEACRGDWEQVIAAWDTYNDAVRDYRIAQNHLETLKSMARTGESPRLPDDMTHSEPDTHRLLSECAGERQRLENLLGQYQGKMSAMGQQEEIRKQLEENRARMQKLEQVYDAATLAQMTLSEASAQLQRRFAPRISAKAQKYMSKLTGGRYDRVAMAEDLTLRAGAGQEDTLRDILWRSEGTVDQLYFALRLAVAEELTPTAPLILDDALVRFDDKRLKNALELLRDQARHRQVILFTCQSREENLM